MDKADQIKKDGDNEKNEITKKGRFSQTPTTPQSIELENFLDISPESISQISIKVSSLGSSPVRGSQISPPIHAPLVEYSVKTRRPIAEHRQKSGKSCCFVVNNDDLRKIEEALKCRLISRNEYENLKAKRIEEDERLYHINEILLLLVNEDRDDGERKIIIEFCHLLEKSKVLFNGLRELPQYGHKQWQSYFGRTFDVYTKLWKFQQQHRDVLDTKYGLKRWQIGEIASKIGQLYYHFYLRTSETTYLREAFAFYQAIRARRYYTHAVKEDKCELMVKKLRYYARFIVVSLLLNKLKLVDDLIRELDNQIIEYGTTYNAEDQMEWTVVVDEVKAFLDAEPAVQVMYNDMPAPDMSNRIHPDHTPYVDRGPHMHLTLQDVVIIGSSTQQAKFSELTIDMYRILQILEKEPIGPGPQALSEDIPPHGPPPAPHSTQRGYVVGDSFRRDNPHKYLLFKPTALQCLVYLASSCNDLPLNGAILLYISADGYISSHSRTADSITGYEAGGFITSGKLDPNRDSTRESRGQSLERGSRGKDHYLLYPGDIYPFTRRPLFIIVESNCSGLIQNMPRHFNQPLVMLLSAQELPANLAERCHQGNLLTLFLNNPLMGFCASCELYTIEEGLLDVCETLVLDFMFQCAQLILRIRIDMNFFAFMGDEFLRTIILRYLFCECSLRMNRNFRSRSQIVHSTPPMPEELLAHSSLVSIIMKISDQLGVRNHFSDVSGPGSGPREPRDQN